MLNPDILLRVAGDPAQVQRKVREIVSGMGREDVLLAETLTARLNKALLTERMFAVLAAIFGFLALILTGIGTAGLFSCLIAQRIPEIGLRMVFGAQRRDVLTMILRQVCVIVLVGTATGIPFARMAIRPLSALLYRQMAFPLDTAAVCLILLFVSALAAFIPARRAAKVDPMVALRYQ
jgi:putative ABC transport system permease protein